MKILISPSKQKQKIPYNFEPTIPIYQAKADYLVNKIKKLSIKKIITAFKCNENIAKQVFEDYKKFNLESYPALFFYSGLQYKNIGVDTLEDDQVKFLLDNLYIIDALYGILKPTDLISNYRLDYHTKLSFFNYNYYKKDLDAQINERVINLCSKEYSKNLNQENLLTISFLQNVKGQIKSYSTHTKIARGQFVRYLAIEESSSIDVLKKFSWNNYYLKDSFPNELIFQKDFL
jgi:hypothetical protein